MTISVRPELSETNGEQTSHSSSSVDQIPEVQTQTTSKATKEILVVALVDPAVKEVIFALPTTMEGDTTSFYINKRLQGTEVEVTTLARGVAVGDELQYADELTLIRSLQQRLPYSTASDTNNQAP